MVGLEVLNINLGDIISLEAQIPYTSKGKLYHAGNLPNTQRAVPNRLFAKTKEDAIISYCGALVRMKTGDRSMKIDYNRSHIDNKTVVLFASVNRRYRGPLTGLITGVDVEIKVIDTSKYRGSFTKEAIHQSHNIVRSSDDSWASAIIQDESSLVRIDIDVTLVRRRQ